MYAVSSKKFMLHERATNELECGNSGESFFAFIEEMLLFV